MPDLSQKLQTIGFDLADRLRGLQVPQSTLKFPEPVKTPITPPDIGIPHQDFLSQLSTLKSKNVPIDKVSEAINAHPNITDKSAAQKIAQDHYANPFPALDKFNTAVSDISAKATEGITLPNKVENKVPGDVGKVIEGMKQGAMAIMKTLNLPSDITEEKLKNSGNPFLQKIAPLVGFAVAGITPIPGEGELAKLGELMKVGESLTPEVSTALREAKGLSAEDIIAKHPNINLKREVPVTDVYGNKKVIPTGEALTPYELKGNKVLLQDGETYIVSKSQAQNVMNNAISGEAKPFAPELKGTGETTLNSKKGLTPTERQRFNELDKMDRATFEKTPGLFTEWENLKRKLTGFDNTKYSSYQLPEGKNYKEILIKAPESKSKAMSFEEFKNMSDEPMAVGQLDYQDYLKEYKKGNEVGAGTFKSSHWDEPNVLSHLRLNERTYKGKPVTFMEELQSDWAREARKEGSTVPKNEMLKNWQELSVKRALQEAVNNKSDYFSWINGEQTSARYNLAKQLEYINWKTSQSGLRTLTLRELEGGNPMHINIDEKGIVRSSDLPDAIGKPINEVFGKGLADKIMEKESGTLKGEGLKFGGEWANNLYDKQVPNIVKDLTGATPEKMDMGLPIEKNTETTGSLAHRLYNTPFDDLNSADKKTIRLMLEEGNPKTTQQGIKLTPEIKRIIKGEAPKLKAPSGRTIK